jgi:hypothetical protein
MLFRTTFIAAASATAAMLALAGFGLPSQSALATVTKTVAVTLTPPPPPGQPNTTFGDGLYQVGVDIAPGTYRSAGGTGCYWARLKTLDTNSFIDSNLSDGPQVVQIQPTDEAFNTKDCQTWQKTD